MVIEVIRIVLFISEDPNSLKNVSLVCVSNEQSSLSYFSTIINLHLVVGFQNDSFILRENDAQAMLPVELLSFGEIGSFVITPEIDRALTNATGG